MIVFTCGCGNELIECEGGDGARALHCSRPRCRGMTTPAPASRIWAAGVLLGPGVTARIPVITVVRARDRKCGWQVGRVAPITISTLDTDLAAFAWIFHDEPIEVMGYSPIDLMIQ